jgi:hypothetical protein
MQLSMVACVRAPTLTWVGLVVLADCSLCALTKQFSMGVVAEENVPQLWTQKVRQHEAHFP